LSCRERRSGRRALIRALITGGAGFIGLHLARRLVADGWRVDLVDDFSRGARDAELARLAEQPGVGIIPRDLTVPGALDDVRRDYNYVFHLAAVIGVARVLEDPYRVLDANVAMTRNTLAAARGQRSLERFAFLSTSEVYAGSLEHIDLALPTPESAPLVVPDLSHPRTSYMLSKVYGEALSQQAAIPFTIFRPHNVYGPRMVPEHVIPELLQRADRTPNGGELEVYSVNHRRTFCYVDDAIEIIVRAVRSSNCADKTLNVGAERPEITIGQLAELVISTVGKRLTVLPRPPTAGSPARRCPDMSLTTSLTGFTAEVDLERGVRETYAWYRESSGAVLFGSMPGGNAF
jgi:UDP-glucose 4-epimerase